jgi:hypothetical protein
MSRSARLQQGPVFTWAPPQSPFQIEYCPALLNEMRVSSGEIDAFGVLYGTRQGDTIRLVSTRGSAGIEPLGVFASRVRGQVFLTEEDLLRFEKADASVAMVIAAETGGFFVRDAAGSLETVRSYEEFSIHQQPVPIVKKRKWPWAAVGSALIPLLFYRPHQPQLALSLHEAEGQLRISWNIPITDTLTILDGEERTHLPIAPGQSTATYARRSGDVSVGVGSAQVRFLGQPLPPTEIERARDGLDALQARIATLREARAVGHSRIAALRRRLQ